MFFCSGATIMRLRKPRTAVSAFALAFILGLMGWHVFAQSKTADPAPQVQPQQQGGAHAVAEQKAAQKQFVRYGPLNGINGYANVDSKTVTLRDSLHKNARVVGKVMAGNYRRAEILDSTPDFLRVRFAPMPELDGEVRGRVYEGWVAWGEVNPAATAIVLDTTTGEVVSRLALPDQSEEGVSSYYITFSPDDSHAMIYGSWSNNACEVEMGDYKIKRCLSVSDGLQLESLFYGPTDGELYAVTRAALGASLDQDTRLSLLRVSGEEQEEPARELSGAATGFLVTRDGRKAFLTHQGESAGGMSSLDVMDLDTMMVRNTLMVKSSPPLNWPGMVVINRDGSKLYTLETDEDGQQRVVEIDTNTGQRARDFKIGGAEDGWDGLMPDSIVGDSLFFRFWDHQEDNPSPRGIWADAHGHEPAERGIAYAIEVGKSRFGINWHGTWLYKLDEKNRIHEKFKITRPELTYAQGMDDSLGIYGMAASPDGKRLIIFIGPIDMC
jgi:hypothetical protein